MTSIEVKASRSYEVLIDVGLLPQIGQQIRDLIPNAQAAAIITDHNVSKHYLTPVTESLTKAGIRPLTFSMPAGEASKNGAQYLSLLELLARDGLSRSDVIIALGGGVVGDLAGFAAATYQRGVAYIQVPTTLLAMVDSSVGGKTAIDLPSGKNLAGAFYQPNLVLCDTDTLRTLPEFVFRDGLAEVIKYGMLGSAPLLDVLTQDLSQDAVEPVIIQCVTMKRDIVQRDEFDHSERMLLNFGHTIGHAIERLSNYEISHGFAVSIGMAMDARAAVKQKICEPECSEILEALLARFGLPNKTAYTAEQIYTAALYDKKRNAGNISIAVPRRKGKCGLMTFPLNQLRTWIEMGVTP
ncbi:MAG: 3-dehydroquinate synthase [Oscillospiraceae bacterium]|nr:3-dehydroquinate synthase [Oscillospiraceae bacterium]